ncbi:MAG: acetyl-CoA carboxylase biotin carboxylase subunit [Actinobacteria bacterium]|nr:acetyl-CoA carboxylase biotin carboxylase subunit [Actinomycetota bacterium]
MFKRILIANRGEIALRIIRACREMGIESVAVYSTADRDSVHTRMADSAVCIGPPQPVKSYLEINNLITAALNTRCDAVHPGYGFLAENAGFVKKCEDNNLVFIGPPADAITLAGNKSKAVEVMKANKVPVIPGSNGNIRDLRSALRVSRRLGYPVMLKASFGGGGRGIRICQDKNDLANFYPMAKAESEKSFGTGELYVEKYIQKPRHIEFQIIADNRARIICAGERECSIQRRHQKLIEEAPAVNLPPRLSRLMREYAVRAARAINYKNLGTIEFLMDENEHFYFIEINTRIQVEHPVTEMVTGLDLVKEQIRIASGEGISNLKEYYEPRGHCIEFRINAEDPDNDFAPSPGTITDIFIPGGPGIRIDTSIGSNHKVSPFYDSMLAKLIVWDNERSGAICRAIRALDEFMIEGIKTTIPFHKKILANEKFRKGQIHTHFIDEEINQEP